MVLPSKTQTERKTEGKTEKLPTPSGPLLQTTSLGFGLTCPLLLWIRTLKTPGDGGVRKEKQKVGHLNDLMLGETLPPSAFPLVGWGPHGSLALQDYVAGSIRESMGKNHGLLITKSFTSCETCSHLLCSISFIKGKKSTSCTQSPVYLNIQRPNFLHKKLCAYPSVQELPITWGPFY